MCSIVVLSLFYLNIEFRNVRLKECCTWGNMFPLTKEANYYHLLWECAKEVVTKKQETYCINAECKLADTNCSWRRKTWHSAHPPFVNKCKKTSVLGWLQWCKLLSDFVVMETYTSLGEVAGRILRKRCIPYFIQSEATQETSLQCVFCLFGFTNRRSTCKQRLVFFIGVQPHCDPLCVCCVFYKLLQRLWFVIRSCMSNLNKSESASCI